MNCHRCQEQFTDYLERSLPARQQEQMAEHLRQCPDCAEELEAFRRAVTALRGLEVVAPPADLLARIKRAVAAQAQPVTPRFRISWQHMSAVAAAAALVVGFVAVFSYQRIGPGLGGVGWEQAETVQKSLGQPVADEKSPTKAGEEKAVVEAPAMAPPPQKSVPTEMRRETKEASGGEPPAGDREPGLADVDAARHAAVPEIETWADEAAAPGVAGGGGAPAVEKRMTLGAGPYGRSSTPSALANVEAGARVVITPPSLSERIVGQPVPVQVTIQPQASVEKAVVRIQPLGKLELADDQPIIYQGPLTAEESKQLSFGIIARETGTQECQMELSSELPGVAASTTVSIPGFEPPPEHVTTQVFEETPLDEAIRVVAREADVKVMVGEGLEQKPVTYDFSEGVPAEVALRILAELGGCQLDVADGTYRICCPAEDDGQ